MKPIYVFFYPGTAGGTATLSIRLGKHLINKGYQVLFICQKLTDTNNVKLMSGIGIKMYCWSNEEICGNLVKKHGKNNNYIFLTYRVEEYLIAEKFKAKLMITKNILYVVHHHGLIKGANQNIIIKRLTKNFYHKIINKMLDNKSVIFMDNKSLEETEKYYGFNIIKREGIVSNLPIEVTKFDSTKIGNKVNLNTFNLLTIARAEFPFKGYIIGLIDDFQTLCNIYNNITLTIISFGRDEIEISEKVRQLPSIIQNKINLIGQTPYDELHTYFNQAHLYLGMGTTILDAVNHGVPSIIVEGYTYNNNSSGFFHTQPELLAAYDKLIPATNYIKNVIQMSKQEYLELCEIEHKKLEQYYGIETFANHLINIETEVESKIFTNFELKTHELMVNLFKMIRKLKSIE